MARYDRILKSLWRVAEGFSITTPPNWNGFGWNCVLDHSAPRTKKWGNCLHGFCQTAPKRVLFFFCHQYNMAFGTHILHRLDHVWNNSHESVSRSVHLWEISEFLHSCFASPKKLPLEALFWVGVLITSVQFKQHIFGWWESFQGLVDIPRMCLLDLDLLTLNSSRTWRVTWPTLPPNLKTLRPFVHELLVITFPIVYHWKCVRGHCACAESRNRGSKIITYLESPTPICLFTIQLLLGYDDD